MEQTGTRSVDPVQDGVLCRCTHPYQRLRRYTALVDRTFLASKAAQMKGYSDQSHPNRHFERFVGMTPEKVAKDYSYSIFHGRSFDAAPKLKKIIVTI
jgi:AraC-like DNA-binding protein